MGASATTRISRLQKMGLAELREQYQEVFAKPTKSRNRKKLFIQIARKLQDGETGTAEIPRPSLTAKFESKRKRSQKGVKAGKGTDKKKRPPKPIGARDPRLPKPGTTIERVYKGKKLLVRVLEVGMEWESKPYRSLSALAQAITGAKAINGYLFFRLGKYAKKEKIGK